MEKTRQKILGIDTPNINGIIYPKAVVEEAVQAMNRDELLVFLQDSKTDIASAAGIASNIALEEDGLYADIKIISTETGNYAKAMIVANDMIDGRKPKFFSVGMGKINDNHEVYDFTLAHITLGFE